MRPELRNARALSLGLTALALTLFISTIATGPARAEKKMRSVKTEARFLSYDSETKTMTVEVTKPGKKPKNKKLKLKARKKATFRVKPEGSVLKRTSVTENGKRASIHDIPKKKTVIIYWVPDEKNPDGRFARKIDMILSEKEAEERDKARLEAEKAAGRAAD